MSLGTYVCKACGGTFEKGWSDEEEAAEYARTFPGSAARCEPMVRVCDDCYQRMLAITPPREVDRHRQALN